MPYLRQSEIQVGALVKYNEVLLPLHKSDATIKRLYMRSLIGIVVSTQEQGARVQWNNGTTIWDNIDVLEVLCE